MSQLTMNQELNLRQLEMNLDKATPEQLKDLCLHYAEQLCLQQNATKDMYKAIAIDGAFTVNNEQ